MQDFNEYAKDVGNGERARGGDNSRQNLINLVTSLAAKFDGKNTNELVKAVYVEAKKGKENGTLSNKDIDNFATLLSPMLDEKKRKMLYKITEELKKI